MLGNLGKSSIALTILAAISATTSPAQAALLVSSGGDNSIKQYDETTGAYIQDFVTSGSGGLSSPQDLALGPKGNLFVVSQGDNTVKEYSGTTGEYIGNFVSLDEPSSLRGLSFGADGSLFVATSNIPGFKRDNFPTSGILQYDGTTGELLNSIYTGVPAFTPAPRDVAVGGPNNSIFISENSNRFNPGGIREYDPVTNNFTNFSLTSIGVPGPVSLPYSPQGLALSGSNLFFTNGQEVGLIDLTNNTIDSFFVDQNSGGLARAVGLTVGENNNLFVVSSTTNNVKQYDGRTGDFLGDFIASGSGGLSSPTYITTANVPVPEPSSVLGLMAFSGLFAGSVLRRKMSDRKQLDLLQK